MDIHVFHMYNRLVRRELVEPISCPDCGHPYVLRATVDGDPVLECFTCDSKIQPGLRLYTEVQAAVKEHFND